MLSTGNGQSQYLNVDVPKNYDWEKLKRTHQIFVDSVWVANKVSFDLYTVDDKQFVAYYDKNRMMSVASRKLGSDTWQRKTLSSKLHWDSHNYVTLGFDGEGHIHISGCKCQMIDAVISYHREVRSFFHFHLKS